VILLARLTRATSISFAGLRVSRPVGLELSWLVSRCTDSAASCSATTDWVICGRPGLREFGGGPGDLLHALADVLGVVRSSPAVWAISARSLGVALHQLLAAAGQGPDLRGRLIDRQQGAVGADQRRAGLAHHGPVGVELGGQPLHVAEGGVEHLMLSSASRRLIWSSASTVRSSTVPPPSSRPAMALCRLGMRGSARGGWARGRASGRCRR
jgi:hypothetical protein